MPLLAHDVDYSFSAAVELCDMTADIRAFFEYFHPDPNGWYDAGEHRRWRELPDNAIDESNREGRRFAIQAELEYLRHRPQLDRRRRAICSYSGLLSLRYQVDEMGRGAAGTAIDAFPDGGLTKRAVRKALSPNRLRRLLKRDPWYADFRSRAKRMLQRLRADAVELKRDHDKISAWITDERKRLADRQHAATLAAMAEMNALPTYPIDPREAEMIERDTRDRVINRIGRKSSDLKRMLRKIQKQRSRVAAKGFALVSSLAGEEKARMFIGGKHIHIEGQRFIFSLTKQNYVDTAGHAGLQIELLERPSHDLGIPRSLAHLCLYFEQTPAIDQVAAIALHVAAGEEDDLIATGNLYRIKKDARDCKALVDLKPQYFQPEDPAEGLIDEAMAALPNSPSTFAGMLNHRDLQERTALRRRIYPMGRRIAIELIDPRLLSLYREVDQDLMVG